MTLPPLNLSLSLSPPSFHPTITFHLYQPPIIPPSCDLAARLSIKLPDEIFLDPDELDDKFAGSAISSYTLTKITRQGQQKGKTKIDIERPSFDTFHNQTDYVILNLNVDPRGTTPQEIEHANLNESINNETIVEIPLHGRYLRPSVKGERTIIFPDTQNSEIRGEWICKANTDSVTSSPFTIVRTEPINIILPTGKHSHQPFVELMTPLVIWSGWSWIVYKIFRLRNRMKNNVDTNHLEKKNI
ncbi:uncharacterized protein L201_006900 [Kwoniella dendrophila CBS 6074]|uniref:Protein PBN1 n=1 Tax=Kwoniella dendrophila CBS 6074 TaxID=1295534 RepID=A0AAX4K5C6_9TREE